LFYFVDLTSKDFQSSATRMYIIKGSHRSARSRYP